MGIEWVLADTDFDTPGKSRGMLDVFRQRYLLRLLLKKGIATRYYGSALGWVWSYVRPAAQFLMYYLVIGIILGGRDDIPLFPIYLFAGIVAVNLFSEVLRNTTSAITDNKALVQKIYLPRELFPIAAVGVAVVHFLPQALLLLVVAVLFGWTLSWLQLAAFLVGITLIIVFALGLGLFFGAINVAYRDAKNFVEIILMFATWASPVLYSWTLVRDRAPEWLFHLYMSNPMTVAVEMFHEAFWSPITENPARPGHLVEYAVIAVCVAVFALVIGQLIFRRLEGSFAQRL